MNREIYPSDNFGVSGDIGTNTDGTLEVIGLLGLPLDGSSIADGDVPTYIAGSSKFSLAPINNRKITVNSQGISGDWDVEVNEATEFSVNASQRFNLKNKAILVNMFGVSDDYNVSVNAVKPVTVNGV